MNLHQVKYFPGMTSGVSQFTTSGKWEPQCSPLQGGTCPSLTGREQEHIQFCALDIKMREMSFSIPPSPWIVIGRQKIEESLTWYYCHIKE